MIHFVCVISFQAMHEKRLTNCHQALGHFDAFYKPVYGHDWPSIRVSLLSLPKHCAVVNIYGHFDKTQEKLFDLGTSNFLLNAETEIQFTSDAFRETPENDEQVRKDLRTAIFHDTDGLSAGRTSLLEEQALQDEQDANDDLNLFVPTEKVYSEKDLLLREEISLNSFESRDIGLRVLPAETLSFPQDLKTFVFPSGVVSRFPSPKSHHGTLGKYNDSIIKVQLFHLKWFKETIKHSLDKKWIIYIYIYFFFFFSFIHEMNLKMKTKLEHLNSYCLTLFMYLSFFV